MRIYYLHGNLQSFDVWAPIIDQLSKLRPELSHSPVNLYQRRYNGFDDWTEDFCHRVESEANGENSLLLGYSLGGRLALHACLARPELWKGAVIVSADPASNTSEVRDLQLQKDLNWANRFQTQSIDRIISEWDALPVFCGIANSAPRRLKSIEPDSLGHLFDVFSKGRQRDLLLEIEKVRKLPILSVSGELDHRYYEISQRITRFSEFFQHAVVPSAGHRVPWEQTDVFCATLLRFLKTLIP